MNRLFISQKSVIYHQMGTVKRNYRNPAQKKCMNMKNTKCAKTRPIRCYLWQCIQPFSVFVLIIKPTFIGKHRTTTAPQINQSQLSQQSVSVAHMAIKRDTIQRHQCTRRQIHRDRQVFDRKRIGYEKRQNKMTLYLWVY